MPKDFNLDITDNLLDKMTIEDEVDFDMDQFIRSEDLAEFWNKMLISHMKRKIIKAKVKVIKTQKKIIQQKVEQIKELLENDNERLKRISALYFKKRGEKPTINGLIKFIKMRKKFTYKELNQEYYDLFNPSDIYDLLYEQEKEK